MAYRTMMQAKRLQFDRYVLDLDRGCLLVDGNEIALRPKTFAVLRHLIENSGRLVSKEDLFAAVWQNLAVTDDALVQSIGELRRALGDDGARLIKTVPRRGYRFEADVSVIAPAGPSMVDGTPATSREDAQSPASAIRIHSSTSSATALTGRRGGLCALAFVVLLVAGALWTGLAFRSGERSTRGPEFDTKPAIAVLPFLDQSDNRWAGFPS
jgi:DNA-binding winged helix-turn-helix (wHTH) protein